MTAGGDRPGPETASPMEEADPGNPADEAATQPGELGHPTQEAVSQPGGFGHTAHEATAQPGGLGRRRGVRTVALSALALVSLAGLAIGVLWTTVSPPDGSAPGSRSTGGTSGRESGAPSPDAVGATIGGTISVAPELRGRLTAGDTLFIILRRGPGPPVAVKRIVGPGFPVRYQVGPEDVMMAGTPFEGQVTISARLSQTGGAGPPKRGDLEGEHPDPVTVGRHGVDIVISRVH